MSMLRPSGLKVPTKVLKPGSTALKTPAAGKPSVSLNGGETAGRL